MGIPSSSHLLKTIHVPSWARLRIHHRPEWCLYSWFSCCSIPALLPPLHLCLINVSVLLPSFSMWFIYSAQSFVYIIINVIFLWWAWFSSQIGPKSGGDYFADLINECAFSNAYRAVSPNNYVFQGWRVRVYFLSCSHIPQLSQTLRIPTSAHVRSTSNSLTKSKL